MPEPKLKAITRLGMTARSFHLTTVVSSPPTGPNVENSRSLNLKYEDCGMGQGCLGSWASVPYVSFGVMGYESKLNKKKVHRIQKCSPQPTSDPALNGCGWESLMKSVTLGNVTMSHRTREACRMPCVSLHSTMIGLRAQH
ncbi:hypothetical protein EVAR_27448_1 [Eumeta japonica]|uniref:Uncharacterized protein n=1 Tax=Eumeta variegata TaxID=151549 RepID=A0A4C1VJ04_EUMVA|nr:hypothetical protein EVAR_27448_1 [Eumeta japonica]